jgi:hypothetical protein
VLNIQCDMENFRRRNETSPNPYHVCTHNKTMRFFFLSIQQDHAFTSLSSKSWSSSLGKSPATLPPHCSPPHWGNRRSLCHPHCSPPGRFARSAKEKALAAGRRQSRPVAAPSSSSHCPQLLRHPRTRGEAVRLLPSPPFLDATLLVLASPLSLFHGPREFIYLKIGDLVSISLKDTG